jgi:hypothetical protein
MFSPEFLITSLIVVLIPGTGVVFTVSTGLAHGRVAGFHTAVGCTLGIVPHQLATGAWPGRRHAYQRSGVKVAQIRRCCVPPVSGRGPYLNTLLALDGAGIDNLRKCNSEQARRTSLLS